MIDADTVELVDVTHAGSDGWSEKAVAPGPEIVTETMEGSVVVRVGDVRIELDSRCHGTVTFDGVPVKGVRKVTVVAEVGGVPCVTVERFVMPTG